MCGEGITSNQKSFYVPSLNTICTAIPFAAYGLYLIVDHLKRLYEINRKAKEQEAERQSEYYKVFFFGGKTAACRSENHHTGPCGKDDCPYKIFRYFQELIESANSTIDICINVFTSKDIATYLCKAHRKNVQVRIIADKNMSTNAGSQIKPMMEQGLEIKMLSVTHTMHSKFLLVDRKKVATGSANFTRQGLTLNWENILVTTQKDIVRDISDSFESLWNSAEVEPFDATF